ncbi:MAG: creatininase family protein [Chloroflexi bacterium]|nr:creatininase family protein [Chloroflexota bacterium]
MAGLWLLQEMTREAARAVAPDALVVFPVGALEQHGPHAPVGTDDYAVEYIARGAAAVAAEQIPVVVAPTLPFGCSPHHLPFGGTMSLSTETYYRALRDLTEALIISGFRRIFIVNGHGGNHELVQLVARDLALVNPVDIAAASYWTIAWEALVAAGAHQCGGFPGHAGAFETSVVLALRPELIQEPRPHRDGVPPGDPAMMTQPYRAEFHGSWQRMNGFTDSPARGTADLGRAYLDAAIAAVGAAFVAFYQRSQRQA